MSSLLMVDPDVDGEEDVPITVEDFAERAAAVSRRHFHHMYYQLHIELLQRFGGASCHPSEFVSARHRSRRAQRVLLHFREQGDRFHLLDTVDDGWYRLRALAQLMPPDEEISDWPERTYKSKRFRSWFKHELRHWLRGLPPFLLQEAGALRVIDNREDLLLFRLGFLSLENSTATTENGDDGLSVFSFSSVGALRLLHR
ncbi:hypothetical protein CDV36_000221 [Fusarium kuroshium]|uniref:Uncharacterized protein n=3 Tax=Fusarium solani species complex TaxID=232080 RepID=A0A3M2SRI3_9HYPO|nr:hypothetical protein CDV36_000221 [Fusarium kuroshium]RSL83136.1 hypothetical protein CEP51_004690 [Fusarium floridanum]RSM07234.1 hypothetical protein CEP52_005298 [Fusarium oligoseptatum]